MFPNLNQNRFVARLLIFIIILIGVGVAIYQMKKPIVQESANTQPAPAQSGITAGAVYSIVRSEGDPQVLKTNSSAIATLSQPEKALVVLYGYQYGNECEWDGVAGEQRDNLKCTLNTALGVGYQCSGTQLQLLNQYIKTDAPFTKETCPTEPDTSTLQNALISLSLEKDSIDTYTVRYSYTNMNSRKDFSKILNREDKWLYASGVFAKM